MTMTNTPRSLLVELSTGRPRALLRSEATRLLDMVDAQAEEIRYLKAYVAELQDARPIALAAEARAAVIVLRDRLDALSADLEQRFS